MIIVVKNNFPNSWHFLEQPTSIQIDFPSYASHIVVANQHSWKHSLYGWGAEVLSSQTTLWFCPSSLFDSLTTYREWKVGSINTTTDRALCLNSSVFRFSLFLSVEGITIRGTSCALVETHDRKSGKLLLVKTNQKHDGRASNMCDLLHWSKKCSYILYGVVPWNIIMITLVDLLRKGKGRGILIRIPWSKTQGPF